MNTTLRLALILALVGCADERLSPLSTAPTATPTATGTGGESGTGGSPPMPGPKVREVYYTNPFGAVSENLLADGDFELSLVEGSGQFGWITFRSNGDQAYFEAETGGLCKSGLRCGKVNRRAILFGRATAAPEEAEHHASLWFKPVAEAPPADDPDRCALADVYVLRCDSFQIEGTLEPAKAPDESGWCEIGGIADASRHALCIYAELGDYDVLVDAATLLPADPQMLIAKSTRRPTTEQLGRMAVTRERIRSRTPFGPPPEIKEPGDRSRSLD